jgi:hypothetical protein
MESDEARQTSAEKALKAPLKGNLSTFGLLRVLRLYKSTLPACHPRKRAPLIIHNSCKREGERERERERERVREGARERKPASTFKVAKKYAANVAYTRYAYSLTFLPFPFLLIILRKTHSPLIIAFSPYLYPILFNTPPRFSSFLRVFYSALRRFSYTPLVHSGSRGKS